MAVLSDVWRRHQHFAFWQTMTALPYSLYTTTVVIFIAAFSGPAAAAAFTASRTLINPAMAVISAIDTLDKPRAARALSNGGLAGLRGSVQKTLVTVLALTGPYLALLAIFAAAVLHLVFGATFQDAAPGVSLLCVAAVFSCLNQAPETALIVLRAGRAMFAVRLGTAICALLALWIGAKFWGFTGCAGALLLTNIGNFAALRLVEGRVEKAWLAP
jgi:O-antigen/teichoic acid export membrane protein